ncbi:MAG TPA: FHA domain-containing protein, partial [Agromyces sp.]|nr:FHA domain-containing protein [Agromyces sp.]
MVVGAVSSSAQRGAPAWDVIVGDRFIAAIGAPAPERVLAALADAAGETEPAVERLVGMFPVGRTGAIGSFALVCWARGGWSDVTVVVRGDAVVDLDSPGGSRRFDARGSRPWLLAEFHDVVAVRITGAEAALEPIGVAANPVAHARASVRASSVEWSAVAPHSPTAADGGARAGAADRADRTDIADTVLVRRRIADADTVLASALPKHELEADTILTSRVRRRNAGGAPVVPSLAIELEGLAGVRSVRGLGVAPSAQRPIEPDAAASVAVPPPPDGPRAVDAIDAVGNDAQPGTAVRDEPAVAWPDASSATRRPVEPVPPAGPRFRVGGGPERILTAPVLIGRRPMPPRVAGLAGPEPELVTVDSPRSVVSGTHLELRLEGARLVATDLRSTNGTTVRSAAGVR